MYISQDFIIFLLFSVMHVHDSNYFSNLYFFKLKASCSSLKKMWYDCKWDHFFHSKPNDTEIKNTLVFIRPSTMSIADTAIVSYERPLNVKCRTV